MSDLITITVRAQAHLPGGAPATGAVLTLELDRYEIDDGHIVPGKIEARFDIGGECVVDVWPNSRGSTGSVYKVSITYAGAQLLVGTAAFPELDEIDLEDYLVAEPYPTQGVLQQLVADAQVAAAGAIAAGDSFVNIDGGTPGDIPINGYNIDGGGP